MIKFLIINEPNITMKILHQASLTFLFIAFFFCFGASIQASIDLEELSQDFVLETKRIEIPGHPYAFNPSIIRWKGSLLLSFRDLLPIDSNLPFLIDCSSNSQIGLIWLDESFTPISKPQMLDTYVNNPGMHSRAEDSRLVSVGEHLYIVYSDNINEIITDGGFRMFVAELQLDGEIFSAQDTECLNSFEGENPLRREKNWVPFDYLGHLYFGYSISPHMILHPLLGTGKCETIDSTWDGFNWKWGELRGGTPALKIDNQYLAFFHSSMEMDTVHSNGEKILHYFMGAYTFSLEPPFKITQISPEPIIGQNFYHGTIYTPYWKPVRVVFPCGYIFDENSVWIAYGRQDHEIWIAKLDKAGLLASLRKYK